ncbi:c-type cytochrome [Teichococcus oryzae]|uniref:C-type cytochrome n=1 Tax=Teichococcus oryzae TaxID=1608942 RepID=A0A5B2TAL4_9PROT|nr:cytochrome c [Pseudoroseomonas oryzae]KAA2211269.1 c-type cytochrome [Pseudoroseomonas oryzae]
MLRILVFVAAVLILCGIGLAWAVTAPRPTFGEADAARFENGDPLRGKVIFDAGQCSSCHATPGQADRLRLGGGLALGSPYGTFHPPNISPDPEHGIGRWRGLDLANAMLSGVSPDGQHYYPAFPYSSYARMRAEDVRDLWAYLRGLEPTPERAPPHALPFPLTMRRGVGFWKLLFLEQGAVPEDPSRNAAWNRGHYLTEAIAHCAECHSTRNLLGAIRPETRFAGGPDQEGTGYVPNITPQALGHWSVEDLVEVLTTGRTPDLRVVKSSMDDVVRNMAALPEEDRRAIATYIHSLPPRRTPGFSN